MIHRRNGQRSRLLTLTDEDLLKFVQKFTITGDIIHLDLPDSVTSRLPPEVRLHRKTGSQKATRGIYSAL